MRAGIAADDIRLIGDDLVSVRTVDAAEAQRIALSLRRAGWPEVVPGADSLVVQFDNASLSPEDALDRVATSLRDIVDAEPEPAGSCTLQIDYGGDAGPDLAEVCRQLNLAPAELIALHSGAEYRVEMLGFTPGFAYLAGLDPRLDVARLATPRERVAAGSVGIAGGRTGIYALAGPGGWPLIGRIEETLFDADATEPFLLTPGMRVRFVAAVDSP